MPHVGGVALAHRIPCRLVVILRTRSTAPSFVSTQKSRTHPIFTRVASRKFALQIVELSAFLARRDESSIQDVCERVATTPGASRAGELCCELNETRH